MLGKIMLGFGCAVMGVLFPVLWLVPIVLIVAWLWRL